MNDSDLIKEIDKEWTFFEDDLPQFEKGDVFIRKEDWENIKIQVEKSKIIGPIFISSQEANEKIIAQRNREKLELKKTISRQKDLITNIPEILAIIIRKNDVDGNNYLLQEIFQEFCKSMDNHGVSYHDKRLKSKINLAKSKLVKLEKRLNNNNLDAEDKENDLK